MALWCCGKGFVSHARQYVRTQGSSRARPKSKQESRSGDTPDLWHGRFGHFCTRKLLFTSFGARADRIFDPDHAGQSMPGSTAVATFPSPPPRRSFSAGTSAQQPVRSSFCERHWVLNDSATGVQGSAAPLAQLLPCQIGVRLPSRLLPLPQCRPQRACTPRTGL